MALPLVSTGRTRNVRILRHLRLLQVNRVAIQDHDEVGARSRLGPGTRKHTVGGRVVMARRVDRLVDIFDVEIRERAAGIAVDGKARAGRESDDRRVAIALRRTDGCSRTASAPDP